MKQHLVYRLVFLVQNISSNDCHQYINLLTRDDILPSLPPTGNFLVSFALHNNPMQKATNIFQNCDHNGKSFLTFPYISIYCHGHW